LKLNIAERLKELELALPNKGKTNQDQDYLILKTMKNAMRDITENPILDPEVVTNKDLKKAGYDPITIDELMKMKEIYDTIDEGRPIGIQDLREKLDDLIDELEKDAKHHRIDDDIFGQKDPYSTLMHIAEKLKELEMNLPKKGMMDDQQNYAVAKG